MLLLDSHVLAWSRFDDGKLGRRTRERIVRALDDSNVAVSAITFWEISMLHDKGRLELVNYNSVAAWRTNLLETGLVEIPVDGEIAARAGALPNMHGDPADRIIVATALDGHQLITSDERILRWTGSLSRLDARE